jgi:hypothetical protein
MALTGGSRCLPNPDEPEPKQGGNWKRETENGKPEMKNGPDPISGLPFSASGFLFFIFLSGLLNSRLFA